MIIGTGGFAREVLWLVQEMNKANEAAVQVVGFIGPEGKGRLNGFPILGDDSWAFQRIDRKVWFVVALGDPKLRRTLAESYLEQGFRAMHLVHPSVHLAEDVQLGAGAILCAGVALTTQITVGDFAIINLNATVGHDSVIGAYATLHPGVNVSGDVIIEENAELGSGAVVLPGLRIGAGAVLGAGAVATKDLEQGKRYIGLPAQEINS